MSNNLISSNRKRALSGWLKVNHPDQFDNRLKLQKFLFFYEASSKVDGDNYELNTLKGYEKGPVFSDVFGDYNHRTEKFTDNVEVAFSFATDTINEIRAKQSAFFVNIMTNDELSDLTHEFNMWKSKKSYIDRGVKHVPLEESDFSTEDVNLITALQEMYPPEYIDLVQLYWIHNKCFVLSKEDYKNLTTEQKSLLMNLTLEEELINPVYVNISEDGVLLVD